jgi:protein-tyrosine phosphatase
MKKLYEEASVQDIANAIREKNGEATTYKIGEMGAAVRGITTGTPTEVYTFDQRRDEVKRFLQNVIYDPSDYTTSQIPNYVTTPSSNRPVGATITVKSAGTLTVVDGYTGNSVTKNVDAGAVTIYNCTPGAVSKFVLLGADGGIIQQGIIKPTGDCRMIYMTNVDNVRDLGGWSCDGGTVKYGLLFRGGEMYGYLTNDGKQQALDMLGILKEIDLRFASELNGRTESGFGPTVDMLWVDMTWNDLAYQKSSGNIKAIFDPLFDYVIANKPTYFHCSAGADRTGVVALLCEAILGVSQSDCDKDYEITSFYSGASTDAEARRRNETPWTREINYLSTYAGETFRDKVVNFMVSCGITIEKINAFRAAMIDGTPETVTADIATYSITKTLTDVTVSNGAASVQQYQPFVASITPTNGKLIESIKVTMGGKDVTAAVLRGSTDVLRRAVRVALTKCTSSNPRAYVIDGQSYCTAITADTGCEVSNVKIMMGGEDVSTFYKDGVIAIPEVIGDIVITATAVAQAPAYTNLLDAAIDMDGNVIGHTPMYKNMRYNSSSGAPVAHSGTNITGLLPVKKGDVVRIRWKGNTDVLYQSIKFFKSDRTQVRVGYTSLANLEKGIEGPVINFNAANGVADFKFDSSNGAAYFSIVLYDTLENVIVTTNEEII